MKLLAMPRQARLDAPGTLHHVIVRGIERRRIVDDQTDRKEFVDRMGQIAQESKTRIYAWAVMTNHVHVLVRSGPKGISQYMRRLMTGYAIRYNRRHQRHGYLFQNRYKSIVCEEEAYFRELVSYIHLNPLRAGVTQSLCQLDRYPWCGHSAIMGTVERNWQDVDSVLSWFGSRVGEARAAYRFFVEERVSKGRRPELVGGGLVRSLGGWSQVTAMRRRGEKSISDERILGGSDFAERLINEADDYSKLQFFPEQRRKRAQEIISKMCEGERVPVEELRRGSRRRVVSRLRCRIAIALVVEEGLSMAETARLLGVTTPAISSAIRKSKN
jgi:REP element-mobilizing transposase RayT